MSLSVYYPVLDTHSYIGNSNKYEHQTRSMDFMGCSQYAHTSHMYAIHFIQETLFEIKYTRIIIYLHTYPSFFFFCLLLSLFAVSHLHFSFYGWTESTYFASSFFLASLFDADIGAWFAVSAMI